MQILRLFRLTICYTAGLSRYYCRYAVDRTENQRYEYDFMSSFIFPATIAQVNVNIPVTA